QCSEPHELITPTGAALLAEFAESFGPMQNFSVTKTGYGLGTRENKTRPNVLRALLGQRHESDWQDNDLETDTVVLLETNLDDVSSETIGFFIDQSLKEGALDVFVTP